MLTNGVPHALHATLTLALALTLTPTPTPTLTPTLEQVIDKLRREAEERERVLAERELRFVTLRDENLRLEARRNLP